MSDESKSPHSIHPAAALLPWYLAGTLEDDERRQVTQHLADCHSCQKELEEVRRLKEGVQDLYSALPGPSPNVLTRVRARIHQEEAASQSVQQNASVSVWETWAASLDTWLRSLFAVRWVPAMAMAVIMAQTTALLWSLHLAPVGVDDGTGTITGPIVERDIPMATVPLPKIRLAFQETTPEQTIRSILINLDGRIIGGPSPEGVYLVEVRSADRQQLEQHLQRLRTQADVIRQVELVTP